ncbi:helix-turn-helix domain-containing protein [Azospirillum thermophilum]|uniref:AraC family transcriptional regulator n=1 Tax=Azospirillum thermophilum TaxID=2202148 RepID=A0A2S2CZW1_9PROT|nr:helix-turn-helix domain-containing protein [Azospirillum thermophilum]AWK90051.1 AraC family transcriptional regulator [Azospirillum thermophilum]
MTAKEEDGPAAGTGGYREARPGAALAAHFRCGWTHSPPPDGDGRPVLVVPDGCVDLLWSGDRLLVAGPDETAAPAVLAPGTVVTGLRFRPGAARHWLGLPLSEITGQRVPLEDLWGARARTLAGRLPREADPVRRLAALQAEVARLAPSVAPPPPDAALLFATLGRRPSEHSLPALRARLETSERSLRRRCHDLFGYGPKTLDRILRFQRFLALARRPEARSLADLALAAGYADQAHLTREVRRLSGRPPSSLLPDMLG